MARLIPDGTSATGVLPVPTPATLWNVEYEANLTIQAAHTFADGVVRSIEGVNWKSRNTALADPSGISLSGDGLKTVITGTTVTTSSWYTDTYQTGPIIFADATDLVSGFDMDDTICIQVLTDITYVANTEDNGYFYGGLMAFDGSYTGATPTGDWYYVSLLRSSSNFYATRTGAASTIDTQATGAGTPTFQELIIYPGTGFSSGASMDNVFQVPGAVTTYRAYGNLEQTASGSVANNPGGGGASDPSWKLAPANLKLGMWSAYLTNGTRDGSVTAKFLKVRVLRRL